MNNTYSEPAVNGWHAAIPKGGWGAGGAQHGSTVSTLNDVKQEDGDGGSWSEECLDQKGVGTKCMHDGTFLTKLSTCMHASDSCCSTLLPNERTIRTGQQQLVARRVAH